MSPDLKKGSILLGRWEIIEFLGEGTLGKVYRAREEVLGRDVAIKQLRPDIASDKKAIEDFENELRVIGGLRHPNIVIIHHYVERDPESGDCFSIMEYVGGNLRDYMKKKGPLSVAAALRIAIDICKPLAEVHFKGITHNDLKPANILLEEKEGEVIPKISDFGARHTAHTGDRRKYLYASPEELKPGGRSMRPYIIWSDLYSLGIILYEMLTDQVPFPFTSGLDDVISGHLYQQPLPPSHKRACISQVIDRVVLRSLQKNPADRYKRASDMAEALEQALQKWEAELEELHTTAKGHLNQEKWLEAEKLYKDILERNPDDQEARKALKYAEGMSHLSARRWEQAAEWLQSVVNVDPNYRDAAEGLELARRLEAAGLYAQALELESKEEWPQIINVLDRVIKIDEDYKEDAQRLRAKAEEQKRLQSSYGEAERLLEEEKWAEATAKFEEIVKEVGPEYKEAAPKLEKARRQEKLRNIYEQGIAHFDKEDWPRAIAALEEVVQLNPIDREVCIKLAHARREQVLESSYSEGVEHFEKREWEKAIQSLDKVIRLAPEYKDAAIKLVKARKFNLYDQAVGHFQREEWRQAIERLEKVSLIDTEYSDAAVKLQEAKTQLRLESLYADAIEHEKAKQWREAIGIYFQIQELAPTSYRDVPVRLKTAIRNNRLQLPYSKGKKLLDDNKQWQEAYYKFKQVVDTDSNFEDATKLLKKAKAEYLDFLHTQARECEQDKKWGKAIQIYTEILEIDSDYRDVSRRLERAKQRRRGASGPWSLLGERRSELYKTLVTIVVEVFIGIFITSYFRVNTFEGLLLVFGVLLMGLGIFLYFILRREGPSNV